MKESVGGKKRRRGLLREREKKVDDDANLPLVSSTKNVSSVSLERSSNVESTITGEPRM